MVFQEEAELDVKERRKLKKLKAMHDSEDDEEDDGRK